jgi:hypothetical protein
MGALPPHVDAADRTIQLFGDRFNRPLTEVVKHDNLTGFRGQIL